VPRYTADSRDRVRDAVDFADLVGTRTELRRSGQGRYEGLCPFHEERTPSFGIDPDQKVYHCFGCQAGGDVFTFVQETEGLDFVGALEFLADRYGVQLEREAEDPQAAERRRRQERLLELLERTATFYVRYLWDSDEAAPAREYLASRGLGEEALRTYRVGYAPSRFDVVWTASKRAGFSARESYDAGLVQRSKSTGGVIDRFRRRIVFPLCDRRGRVLGFGARALGADQQPKYLNSSDNAVFHKGRHVFGADIARAHATRAGSVVLCEGYTDVIALHQAGLRNAVGLMGTALTDEQVGELARLAPKVLLALDADAAGQSAMLRAARVAAGRRLELRVVPLPAGEDPADVALARGPAEVRRLVDESIPFVRFRVERELERGDLGSAEGIDAVLAELGPVFADLPPSAVRNELLGLVSERTGQTPSFVSSMLARHAAGPQAPGAGSGSAAGGRGASSPSGAPGAPGSDQGARNGGSAPATRQAVRPGRRDDPGITAARDFLAACIAFPDAGDEALAAPDVADALPTDLLRRTAEHLRGHLRAPASDLDHSDAELAALVAELTVRATQLEAPSRSTVEAQALSLRVAHLDREIEAARRAGTGTVSELATRRERLKHERDLAIGRMEGEGAGG
jgi:DNA primase